MFDMFDSNSKGWFMRLMDDEVEGMVVDVEGTVEEVEVELVSAIVGPWDRESSDTMKRFNSDRKEREREIWKWEKKNIFDEKKITMLDSIISVKLQYI